MTQAILAQQAGGPDVLDLKDLPRPAPGPGQILIKVAAAGVNYIDIYQRTGSYKVPFPFTPGAEASGTVEEVGPGVTSVAVGDRVATGEGARCYAGYTVLDANKALPVPDDLDEQTAAALPMQGMTAHYLVNSAYRVEAGQTVLTHAGAGGVGQILIQLLKAKGARVITTVSTDEKALLARETGADHVLRYADFADQVRDLTDGEGVHVVYDGVGKDTFDDSLSSLRIRGSMVLFGATSGAVPPIDPQRLVAGGSLNFTRPSIAHFLLDEDERRWRSGEIFAAAARGDLKIQIGGTYPLAEAARAHSDLEQRRTTGKLLLLP